MVGERIRQLRRDRCWTQEQLAGKLQVSKQAVSGWEKNHILPSVRTLVQLARIFSTTTDHLLDVEAEEWTEPDRDREQKD